MIESEPFTLNLVSTEFDGVPFEGVPVVVSAATMQIEFLPTEFLVYNAVVRGRSRSPLTWKAQGHILVPFLNSMVRRRVDWQRPLEEQLAGYRNQLEKQSLGKERIRRIMSFVCSFYEWAQERRYLSGPELSYEAVVHTHRGLLAHVKGQALSARSILLPRVPKRRDTPRYFTIEEQQRIFEVLPERSALVAAWALHTGAREHEICNLVIGDIPSQAAYRARRSYPIRILGKGGKLGDLHTPTWLLDKTYRYIKFFGRRKVVQAAARRGRMVSDHIFLGRWGSELKPNTVYREFKRALRKIGLRGTFHDMRHTYAIWTLDALMKTERHSASDGRNALLELQKRMRHQSLETTAVYLEARNFYLDDIESELWILQ